LEYKEANAAAAMSKKVEADGIKAEQNAAMLQVIFPINFHEFSSVFPTQHNIFFEEFHDS
jgi:hypothetical protein